MSVRPALLDNSYWKTHETVRESHSIGQFLLNNSRNCPRDTPYWTVLIEKLTKMSVRAILLDSSYWITHENVRETGPIRQFLLKNSPNCPREAALLDSSYWKMLETVREKPLYWTVLTEKCSKLSERNRSIRQFLLNNSRKCPWDPLY